METVYLFSVNPSTPPAQIVGEPRRGTSPRPAMAARPIVSKSMLAGVGRRGILP